ncbi:hypothetical protein [Rhodococcus jostii]|uniref:hypothetical protein n=1 Tax=Rhodococcus jostii TaxID=132919 RepID=UPI003633F032
MTADHTPRTRRRASLRKLLYAPLAVSVLAGAVCAGTGIGFSAPDVVTASSSTPDTPPASTDPGMDWWTLANVTGQPIYGEWSEQSGSAVSKVHIVPDMQLSSPGHESRPRTDNALRGAPYWMGHICYNHVWWNFPRTEQHLAPNAQFTLDVVKGKPRATWMTQTGTTPSVDLTENKAEGSC